MLCVKYGHHRPRNGLSRRSAVTVGGTDFRTLRTGGTGMLLWLLRRRGGRGGEGRGLRIESAVTGIWGGAYRWYRWGRHGKGACYHRGPSRNGRGHHNSVLLLSGWIWTCEKEFFLMFLYPSPGFPSALFLANSKMRIQTSKKIAITCSAVRAKKSATCVHLF